MLFIEVFTRKIPFSGVLRDERVSLMVIHGSRPERPTECPEVTDELWSLMERCWKTEKTQRPTISSVLDDLKSITCNALQDTLKGVYTDNYTVAADAILRSTFDEGAKMDDLLFERKSTAGSVLLELIDCVS
jgi:hypothetical protein